jgi:hypothetical protein
MPQPQASGMGQIQGSFTGQQPGRTPFFTQQAPTQQFSGGGSGIGNQVQGLLSRMIAQPTAYDDNVIKAQRDAALSGLDQQAKASQDQVNEEMARRGVWASSVAGGRLGDIEVNRLNARKGLEADFLNNRARAMDAGSQAAAGLGMQYDQDQFGQSLGAFNANLNARGLDQDNAYRWAGLGENARQFNQGYGLDRDRFGEDTRRYGQDFGESSRRYDQGFGEDARRYGQDFGESSRRYDQGFGEDQRRYGQDFGESQRRDNRNFGEDSRRWDKDYGFRDRDWNQQAMRDLLGDYDSSDLTEMYDPLAPPPPQGGGYGGPNVMPFDDPMVDWRGY